MPFIFLLFTAIVIAILLQLGIFGLVLSKLGISPDSAMLLLSSTLFGSLINLPIIKLKHTPTKIPDNYIPPPLFFSSSNLSNSTTIIAINAGGALIPVFFSIYLLTIHNLIMWQVMLATGCVTLISYSFSRPIKGLGIGMPIFIAPLTAALSALIIAPEQSAPLAYISGTLGVLIGADLLRIKDIRQMNVPIASIGGAGTFDGIFFTGIIAVILA